MFVNLHLLKLALVFCKAVVVVPWWKLSCFQTLDSDQMVIYFDLEKANLCLRLKDKLVGSHCKIFIRISFFLFFFFSAIRVPDFKRAFLPSTDSFRLYVNHGKVEKILD